MRFVIIFLFLFSIMAFDIDAQETFTPPVKFNTAFMSGEKLTYQIRYGFITGGITTFSLTEELYKNKMVFHALVTGKTTGVSNQIYGVKDTYESWFDKETNLPYKQARNIKEGHYRQNNEVTYNRKNNTVNSKLSGEHSVPGQILDLTSAFYYIRRIDFSKLKTGDVIFMNLFFSDEIKPFHLMYMGKETIRTKFGKISCLKICPIVEPGRTFKTKNDLTIWFTDDDSCLPVLVKLDIRVVGNVWLKLIKYENMVNSLVFQQ